jgi:hypothetical protein
MKDEIKIKLKIRFMPNLTMLELFATKSLLEPSSLPVVITIWMQVRLRGVHQF